MRLGVWATIGRAAFGAATGLLCAKPAIATPDAVPAVGQVSDALNQRIAAQDWAGVWAAIAALPPGERATQSIRFVEAYALRRTGAPRKALGLYQAMLADDSSLQRVRLELAQTFREVGDTRAAEHNFRLALASGLPEIAQKNVRAILAELAEVDRWRIGLSGSIAPDSNINTATSATTSDIFGLPFTLSDEARRVSGVSVNLGLTASRRFKLGADNGLLVSAYSQTTQNRGESFDQTAAGFRVGPQWRRGSFRFEAQAVGERQWFATKPYMQGLGVELAASNESPAGWARIGLSARRQEFDQATQRDGWAYGVDWRRAIYLSANRFIQLGVTGQRVEASSPVEAYWSSGLSVGLYQSLPAGFGLYVEPRAGWRRHDARNPLFGAQREDISIGASARMIKRDWQVFGFNPYVGLQVDRNDSSIGLEDYDRVRGDCGFTRAF
jgi:hypothetical protein